MSSAYLLCILRTKTAAECCYLPAGLSDVPSLDVGLCVIKTGLFLTKLKNLFKNYNSKSQQRSPELVGSSFFLWGTEPKGSQLGLEAESRAGTLPEVLIGSSRLFAPEENLKTKDKQRPCCTPGATRGGGLGSRPIFKKFNEPYAPS